VHRLKEPDTIRSSKNTLLSFGLAPILLFLVVAIYILVFSTFSILSYRNFSMSAYDIGIHAQAIWKLSTGHGLFNTVRGLPIWGDHCWFVMVLYAPLYWIFPRVETLLALQSFALALGALPLAVIILRRGGGGLAALLFGCAWLLSPALQNMNLENYHPEVLAAPFLLWSIERADAQKWRGYWIAIGIALLCKEDVALTTFMIGCWVFLKNKKAGFITIMVSLLWFFLCMKVFLPFFNNEGFFRFQGGYWFSQFWQHKLDPRFYWETLLQARVGMYAWKLGLPLLFLFLLNPLLAAAALPSFMVNVLSGNDYLISIEYHYNFQTLPMLFAASAFGFTWLQQKTENKPFICRIIMFGVFVASLWANGQWSYLPVQKVHKRLSRLYSFYKTSGVNERFNNFFELLPIDPEVPIAVSHNLLPNIAHRNEVYMFPNPFRAQYWGIQGENLPSPENIEMLFLDISAIGQTNNAIFKRLVETGDFFITKQEGSLVLAQKAEKTIKYPVTDPLTIEPPPEDIRLLVYLSKSEVVSLVPLWGKKPDFDIKTKEMRIPLTTGRLNSAEGLDLGNHDNLRLFFLGSWRATGKEQVLFRLQADDGCRLYIDGNLALDYEGVHAFGQKISSSPLQLAPGLHTIALDYFEWGGEAGLQVEWAKADGTFQVLQTGQILP
jgi:uncharacterized membrane protein